MEQTKTVVQQRTNERDDEPKRYRVWIFNDDFTTMDFVVEMLCDIFEKSPLIAENIMLRVHHNGKAVAGLFSLDMAQSKVRKATRLARGQGFPLRFDIEPED